MSAYRDAYFKVLCRTVAEWVASRDDVVAFEVAKHGPGAFDSSKRGEHSPDREVVTVKFDILGEPYFAAFVAGSGERPENDTREIIEPLMEEAVKGHIARCEISISSIIGRTKAKADAEWKAKRLADVEGELVAKTDQLAAVVAAVAPPCRCCGRSVATHLTITEANARDLPHGICSVCKITTVGRS